MKLICSFIIVLSLLSACKQNNKNIQKIAERTDYKLIQLDSIGATSDILNLYTFVNSYKNRDVEFDLNLFENQWAKADKYGSKSGNNFDLWTEITGLLLELSQKEKYAAELERINERSTQEASIVAPFVLTKNIDHIYVNLFQPTELRYSHSLGGEVTFKQETDYPESGSIKLHFGMTLKRYIELHIRIPEWAEGATVTVKQVKYFTKPGAYCKIAKQWKEGDLVEIELPIHLRPGKATTASASASGNSETNSE